MTESDPARTVATTSLALDGRRLRLDGLDVAHRRLIRVALGVLILLTAAVFLFGLRPAAGEFLPRYGRVHPLFIVTWLIALALTSVLWCLASVGTGAWRSRAVRLVLALLGATVGASLARAPRVLKAAAASGQETSLPLARTLGWLALALAFAALVPPLSRLARRPLAAGVFMATPYLAALVAYLATGGHQVTIDEAFLARPGNTTWPATLSHRGAVAMMIMTAAVPVVFAAQILFLAEVIAGVRASRDGVLWIHERFIRPAIAAAALTMARLAAGILAVKAGILGLGLLGVLPGALGRVIHESRSDGFLSWALATGLAVAAAGAVVRSQSGPSLVPIEEDDRVVRQMTLGVVIAVALAPALTATAAAVEQLLRLGADRIPDRAIESVPDGVNVLSPWVLPVVIGLAIVSIPLVLSRRPAHWLPIAAFATTLAVWCGPRAVTIVVDLIAKPAPEYPIGDFDDYVERSIQTAGWVNVVTFDVMLTLALIVLLATTRRKHPDSTVPAALVSLILLTTTVFYAGALVPGALKRGAFFYAGLSFPLIYGFLFDAGALNRSTYRRTAVPFAVGTALLTLASTALLVATGSLTTETRTYGEFASAMLKVPLLAPIAVLVVATVSKPRTEVAQTDPPWV